MSIPHRMLASVIIRRGMRDHRARRAGGWGACSLASAVRAGRVLARIVLAAAVSVLAFATILLATAAATARPGAASIGRCSTADLAISVTGRGGGTAGSDYFHIEFRNDSRQACRISGYPGVSAVDAHARRIGLAAGREVTGRPAAVTLGLGRRTSAILHATDVGVLPPSSCRQATPSALRIYPPDDTTSKLVPFHYPVCTATVSMRVRAVKTEAGF